MTLSQFLSEVEKRAEKATPGPWEWDRDKPKWQDWISPTTLHGKGMECDVINADDYCMEIRQADHAFIQHARTDLPTLVAIVREMAGALEFIAVPGALQTREDWQMKRARAALSRAAALAGRKDG